MYLLNVVRRQGIDHSIGEYLVPGHDSINGQHVMEEQLRARILSVRNEIREIRDAAQEQDGYWLDFKWDRSQELGDMEGNTAGLLQMAMLLVDLASKEFEGAHVHLDEHSNLGEGCDSLVVWKSSE